MRKNVLLRGFVAAHVGEALANYALADKPLEDRQELARSEGRSSQALANFRDDQDFWRQVFEHYADEDPRKKALKFQIVEAALSEWVPRVPGLYWRPGSEKMRRASPAQIEKKTKRWTTYRPLAKSRQVSGGVGTLRFRPSEDGFRLVTLTTTLNASAGVPALIAPTVWDAHDFAEGDVVYGTANWREMPQKWANQFPSVAGIPRGCLIVDNERSIQRRSDKAPILAHPFSVMEYSNGDALLHDFVYAGADTANKDFRRKLSGFFEEYRTAEEREGEYLMAADIPTPMWKATFDDPAEMRQHKAAQLRVIEARVLEAASGEDIVEALIRKLSNVTSPGDLRRLSEAAGIKWRSWSEGGRLVDEAERLVDAAIESKKQQALLQVVQME